MGDDADGGGFLANGGQVLLINMNYSWIDTTCDQIDTDAGRSENMSVKYKFSFKLILKLHPQMMRDK